MAKFVHEEKLLAVAVNLAITVRSLGIDKVGVREIECGEKGLPTRSLNFMSRFFAWFT